MYKRQQLSAPERAQLVPQARLCGGRQYRDQPGDRQRPGRADHDHHQHGRPPPQVLAEQGRGGHTDDIGEGQPGEHHRDRPGPPVRGDEFGRRDRPGAEERPVRQSGDQPGGGQRPEVRGERAEQVPGGEEPGQGDQHRLPGPPGRERGEQRCPDHHTQCVGGDQPAGLRDRDVQIVRDLGQQPHGGELGGSDGEGGDGQGDQRERQGGAPGERAASKGRRGTDGGEQAAGNGQRGTDRARSGLFGPNPNPIG